MKNILNTQDKVRKEYKQLVNKHDQAILLYQQIYGQRHNILDGEFTEAEMASIAADIKYGMALRAELNKEIKLFIKQYGSVVKWTHNMFEPTSNTEELEGMATVLKNQTGLSVESITKHNKSITGRLTQKHQAGICLSEDHNLFGSGPTVKMSPTELKEHQTDVINMLFRQNMVK